MFFIWSRYCAPKLDSCISIIAGVFVNLFEILSIAFCLHIDLDEVPLLNKNIK